MLAAAAAAVMVILAIPVLSLRLGSSDQGNDPAATTTRQAYDLLADGFGPGFNGPLQLVGAHRLARRRGRAQALQARLPRTARTWPASPRAGRGAGRLG